MFNKDPSKHEIEEELKKRGDFIQIDYLSRILKKDTPFEIKKFVLSKLSEIYEKKKMFTDAAKTEYSLAIISTSIGEKIKHHTNEAKLCIQAGVFQRADEAMNKAIHHGNAIEKSQIYIEIKQFYKKLAEDYEKEKKRNQASKLYEKLMDMKISDIEKQELKEKLLNSYDKLGKTKEYFALKKSGEKV